MRINQSYIIVLFIIGALGFLAFFPFPFHKRYTCLYHRWTGEEAVHTEGYSREKENGHASGVMPHDLLLDKYMHRFAFIWWLFAGMTFYAVYSLMKKNHTQYITGRRKRL